MDAIGLCMDPEFVVLANRPRHSDVARIGSNGPRPRFRGSAAGWEYWNRESPFRAVDAALLTFSELRLPAARLLGSHCD
jgi:hypothetical protein